MSLQSSFPVRAIRVALNPERRHKAVRMFSYARGPERRKIHQLRKQLGQHDGRRPVPVAVRGVPDPISVRPGTSDADVVFQTFAGQYHLPPAEAKPVRVIADLGANIGLTALDFALRYPQAQILSVELDDELAQIAIATTERWSSRVTVVSGAVWTQDGTINYDLEYGDEHGAHVAVGASRTARSYSLDTLLAPYDQVDYVKMDLEGAEAEILGGECRWAAKVRTIKVEVHAPFTLDLCRRELERLGFEVSEDNRHSACSVGVRRPS